MKNNLVLKLKQSFYEEGLVANTATDGDILEFEKRYNLFLPDDLKQYFKLVNGSAGKYDKSFFLFQSMLGFKSIDEELRHHNGAPDYSTVVNTLQIIINVLSFAITNFI